MNNINIPQEMNTPQEKEMGASSNSAQSNKNQATNLQTWGVTGVAAVAGGVVMAVAARGALVVLAALASTPVSLTIGAIGGGLLGWRYMQRARQSSATQSAENAANRGEFQEISIEATANRTIIGEQPSVAPEPPKTPTTPLTETAIADPLEEIHGIGPVVARHLQSAGIHTFAQLAELSPEQVSAIIAPVRASGLLDPASWIAEAAIRVEATKTG